MADDETPYPTAEKLLIFLQISGIFFYVVVVYPMIRYQKFFYSSHYFYKAAVQLAVFDILGLIFAICDVVCQLCGFFCLGNMTIWVQFFITEVMLVVIAFNRFFAVVFYQYYPLIFNSKWATWLFLIPILASTYCLPLYLTCSTPGQSTCWYFKLFHEIYEIATVCVMTILVSFYVVAYFYLRFFSSQNQLNENRFLYQAAISGGYLFAVFLYNRLTKFNPFTDLVYSYLITGHFISSPIVYLCFNASGGVGGDGGSARINIISFNIFISHEGRCLLGVHLVIIVIVTIIITIMIITIIFRKL